MIGKCRVITNNFKFAFTLTISGVTTSFDEKTASTSGSNYSYVRDDIGWYLIVYANATINFSKLSHNIDFSLCGGGGGGGGSSQKYNWNGGGGGGGEIIDSNNYADKPEWIHGLKLTLDTDYSIVVGSGGAGGGRSGSGWGGYGTNGSPSTFNSISAAGGIRGNGAADTYSGAWGYQRSAAYVFGDSSRINTQVSGYNNGLRGCGGKAGIDASGWSGGAGLFVMRSSIK